MNTLMRKSLVLGFVCLQLYNKVHEVLWLSEKLKLFGIDEIAKLVFYLDN